MSDNGRLLRLAPWFAGAVLLASLAVGGWAYWRDQHSQEAIDRDRSLIVRTERLLSFVKDVETGARGFLITGRDSYLEAYDAGIAAAPEELRQVAALAGPDAGPLSGLVTERMREAAEAITTFRRDGAAAAVARVSEGAGKGAMDRVRAEVARLQHGAEGRIATLENGQQGSDLLRLVSVIGLVTSCAVLGSLAVLRRRQQQASQLLFEGVMEHAPIGLGILDGSLRIRHINHALAKMSERALGATPGASIWDVIPQMRVSLEPRLKRILGGGRAASADVEAAGTRGEPRFYQVNFYPLQRPDRRSEEGVGMVIADITARTRAERATKASEQRFRSLVQASAAMIWTADATGGFAQPQPSWTRFTGQPEPESLGWGRLDAVHPDDVDRTREAWRVATGTGMPIALEHRVRRADGQWRHMALNVAPVLEEDGTLREWIGSHTDITDRKEAELVLAAAKEAAESANRAKSAFLANMSHELRTPLSAVIGYSEMLEEEAEDAGARAMLTDLGKIKSNAKHLLGLINDVLDLSKVEANKMDLFAEEFDLATFLRDAAATVSALIGRKSNHLTIDLSDDLGGMRTDAVKLRQCLFNLLSNAAKFTENGTITLSAHRERTADGDWITIAVRDTGIGMTADQLSRLFQRFSQADETTTRRFGGTGLGLALSRAFAELLGGTIAVESTEGAGTCFTLRLPAVLPERLAEPGDEELPAPADVAAADGRRRELVLVIDDEPAQRDLMTRFLQRQGFAVQTAGDGITGLALARSLLPRVVLLDVMMPGLGGWDVLKALKDDPATASIPVVMVSFVAEQGISVSLGAADAVRKPVDWPRLKAVMERFSDGTGSVLVIDDDPDTRDRLRSVLERSGWTVEEAGNGAEALDIVARALPNLILLDLTMPVMDGFSFLHRLRQTSGCADVPVVVLSARDITRDERERLNGADRIFRKGETSMRDLTAELRKLNGPTG